MHSSMNVIMVWVLMLSLSHALGHERYDGSGMDVSLSHALEHERLYGWGMDALVIACTRT